MKTTQKDKVKAWLLDRKAISQQQAIREFACYRLAPIIHTLRGEGLPIQNLGTRYAVYKLPTSYFLGQVEMVYDVRGHSHAA